MPLLSLITAVWNRETTLGDAIESAKSQSFGDFEHLLIDGASTDGSVAAAQAVGDQRLKVWSEPDQGIYDALNKGIARASGDIIGLLHSDDLFAGQHVLQHVSDAFSDPRIDAVYGDLDYVSADDTSKIVRHWQSSSFEPRLLARGWMPPHPTLFLRRRILDRLGGYDTSYRIAADYDSVLRYFSHESFRAHYIPEVFVKMRVGGESNRSFKHVWIKSCEDYRALRQNRIGGMGTLAWKNFSKIGQFFNRSKG